MGYNLTNLPGNFLTAATGFEAFEFEAGSGNYAGLVVPSRSLVIAGGSPVLTRVQGRRGRAVEFPASCQQFMYAGYDNAWNALGNEEGYLACAFWYKATAASGFNGIGFSESGGSAQWFVNVNNGGTIASYLWNSADSGPSIDSGVAPQVGAWTFVCAQYYFDGIGTGVNLKLRVNGTDYPTISGSLAITPNFPAANFGVGAFNGAISENCVFDQLLLWKSGTAWLNTASIDALYNNGSGIRFLPSGRRRLPRLLAAGII